ncbi:unnamed protein product [Boreogadus saida]
MSTLSSMFLLVRIVHVTYVPTVHQLNMSIESALLSVENGRVLGGRVAYLLTQRTVYQWLWRGRWRERAGEMSHRYVPGCSSELVGSSFSGVKASNVGDGLVI